MPGMDGIETFEKKKLLEQIQDKIEKLKSAIGNIDFEKIRQIINDNKRVLASVLHRTM